MSDKIVYLFGAGATHAELSRIDPDANLTMSAINDRIYTKLSESEDTKKLYDYFSHANPKNLNIEHLISLIESIKGKKYSVLASKLRELFQDDILSNLKKDSGVIQPNLTNTLLKMHSIESIRETEKLQGVITLNYDNLLDIAYQRVYKKINYGITCRSEKYQICETESEVSPLLKIHGSFNWKQGNIINILEDEDFLKSYNSLWIPPSIEKRIESYPYNYLWGQAFELLNCNILRIVGCSLNQNDWGLLSLLFKTQFIAKTPYSIELIDKPKKGEEIRNDYPFLKKVKSIEEIDLKGLFSIEDFDEKNNYRGSDSNFFEKWLKTKLKSFGSFNIRDRDRKTINDFIGETIL